MTATSLFKRAFVRGLNTELIRAGAIAYPSKEASDFAADYIADNSGMPDPHASPAEVTVKVAQALCDNLVQASQNICKEAGGYQPELTKTATDTSPQDAAIAGAWEVMEKAAADTGALIEGGEVPNDQPAAAGENAEAALEANQRPENYANLGETGVGNYERKAQGAVGTEEQHPEKPGATGEGANSNTETTAKHSADLESIVKQAVMGLMEPGKDSNDMPAAATENAEAAQEQARRGENYANKGEAGVGRSEMVPAKGDQVGTEQKHPEAPKATDTGKTNVPLEHVKSSAYVEVFKEAATSLVPYLPKDMEDAQKVAHVKAAMGFETNERAQYLENLYTTLGAKKEAAESVRDHFIKSAECDASHEDKAPTPPAMAKKEEEKKEEKTASLSTLSEAINNLNT